MYKYKFTDMNIFAEDRPLIVQFAAKDGEEWANATSHNLS